MRSPVASSGPSRHSAVSGPPAPGIPSASRTGSIRALHLAVSARIEDAEIPALLVLHRRRAVGIEHVALVEHGIRDLLDQRQCSRLHRLLACAGGFSRAPLPRSECRAAPCTRTALEDIPAQAQPSAVRVVDLHHVAPDFDRQTESRLLAPGDRRDLQRAVRAA